MSNQSNTIGRNGPKRGSRLPNPFEPLNPLESEIGSTPVRRTKTGQYNTTRGHLDQTPRDGRSLVKGSNHPDSVLDGAA